MPKLKVAYTSLATKFSETKSQKMGIKDAIKFLSTHAHTHTHIYLNQKLNQKMYLKKLDTKLM